MGKSILRLSALLLAMLIGFVALSSAYWWKNPVRADGKEGVGIMWSVLGAILGALAFESIRSPAGVRIRKHWIMQLRTRRRYWITLAALVVYSLGWSTYQYHWIQQRHAALEHGGITGCDDGSFSIAGRRHGRLSFWLFGEPSYIAIFMSISATHEEYENAKRLFPEAHIY